jgi:hypothetical protein
MTRDDLRLLFVATRWQPGVALWPGETPGDQASGDQASGEAAPGDAAVPGAAAASGAGAIHPAAGADS